MPYSATAYRLLVSAPGDLPDEDITACMDAVARWNAIYGEQFGVVVVPKHWKQHSAAEYGTRPRVSLNEQLVESADLVIALFWHRLGSWTGEAESGTIEEIERAHERGAYVAILRSRRDISPDALDPEQLERLRQFYDRIQGDALILDYSDAGELAQHVDTIINRTVSTSQARAEAASEAPVAGAQVWPRIERSQRVKTTAGPPRGETHWELVLSNTGTEPARNVRWRLEHEDYDSGELPQELGEHRDLENLTPGGEAAYTLIMFMGVTEQARCIVNWEDSRGEQESFATLRFF